MKRKRIVSKKLRVEGPLTTRDSMKRGRKENSDSVLGLASAWQY